MGFVSSFFFFNRLIFDSTFYVEERFEKWVKIKVGVFFKFEVREEEKFYLFRIFLIKVGKNV